MNESRIQIWSYRIHTGTLLRYIFQTKYSDAILMIISTLNPTQQHYINFYRLDLSFSPKI